MLNGLICRQSSLGVEFKTIVNPVLCILRDGVPDWIIKTPVASDDVFLDFFICLAHEGRESPQHKVRNDSYRPHIGTVIVNLAFKNFWADEIDCSTESAEMNLHIVFVIIGFHTLSELRHAKVNELGSTFFYAIVHYYNDIVKFEIPMHDILAVEVLNSTHDVVQNVFAVFFWYSLILNDVITESLSLDQLHYDIDVLVVVAALIKLNDIGMIHAKDVLDLLFQDFLHESFVHILVFTWVLRALV